MNLQSFVQQKLFLKLKLDFIDLFSREFCLKIFIVFDRSKKKSWYLKPFPKTKPKNLMKIFKLGWDSARKIMNLELAWPPIGIAEAASENVFMETKP